MIARLRPGRIGRWWQTTLLPRNSVYSSSRPRRSYSLFLFHSSRVITRSIFCVSLTLNTPNRALTSTIPIPRSSIKCLVISGAVPTSVSSLTLRISTTSSLTRRCPRLISSRAASLLPIPLSPMISTPTPYTSTSTPWIEMHGASSTFSQRIISAVNSDVFFSVWNTGILAFSAISRSIASGGRFLQKIRHGIL